MGNCSGFCMSTNPNTNAGEENTGATNKKVITADKVREAYREKEDMMAHEGGAAGAAQYEEAYSNNRNNQLFGNNNGSGPRKLGSAKDAYSNYGN